MKKDDLNKKQRYALDTMLSGSNVFLTGDAGTGKTTVIQTFIDEAEKAGKNILVSATTGIAADNIGYGATTVHRALNISIKFEDYKKKVKSRAELLKEADIVVTNPPFSLFREYVAQLLEYDKKLLIIGNKNALTYKEIFPLIQENKLWTGYRGFSGGMWFKANYEGKTEKNIHGEKIINVPSIWYTNLDIQKRHENLILYKTYSPNAYPKYINYDAIEVSKTELIPYDYDGVMGVPITFMDKYNPEQFEIIGIGNGGELGVECGVSANLTVEQCAALFREDKSFRKGKLCYRNETGKLVGCYARILIKKK